MRSATDRTWRSGSRFGVLEEKWPSVGHPLDRLCEANVVERQRDTDVPLALRAVTDPRGNHHAGTIEESGREHVARDPRRGGGPDVEGRLWSRHIEVEPRPEAVDHEVTAPLV